MRFRFKIPGIAMAAVLTALTATSASARMDPVMPRAAAPVKAGSNPGSTFMYYRDINTQHQRCLGITSAKKAILATCTYVHDQAWYRGAELKSTGFYQYSNAYGLCLSLAAGDKSGIGTQLTGAHCGGSRDTYQYWDVAILTDSYLCEVTNYKTHLFMVPSSDRNGSAIVEKPWAGFGSVQQWVYTINSNN
jgi:hypothetical protein